MATPRRNLGPAFLHLRALARNVLSGARVALFLPVRALDFRASPGHFALLVVFNFVVWVGAAAARAGFQGALDPQAIPVYLATVPLVLATALIVASLYRKREQLLLIAVALSACDPLLELAGLALFWLPLGATAGFLYLAFFVWVWVAALRALAVAAGTERPQLYQGMLAVSAMLAVALFVFPSMEVWREPEREPAPPALSDERLFHRQGELIERSLSGITAGRKGVPELYFVGFAPDGSQDVFVREMRYVTKLFEERFGTRGRSIALVSGETTLDEFPVASVTNLRRALARVGEAMNADEDALFLFVSAHGGEDHQLSAQQRGLSLSLLSPTALARILQDAGIRWKVVVVSACFSGGFIEPLRDENTLIVTASSADRHSFGCEHGEDFTYFGRAYFRDALARTRSFVDAFAIARDIVARQETEERLRPSQPQILVGPGIAERLKAFAVGG